MSKIKIISCASYYGSGSSVITDFVSEFDEVYSFTDEEFRFVQDPDGISDLEYNLVENFNRHNSGHALKRFIKLARFLEGNKLVPRYEKFFYGNWKKYYSEYVSNLTDFTFKGWWQYDLIDRGGLFYFRKRFLNKILKMTIWRKQPERTLNTLRTEITYCSHPSEEKFLKDTKNFIDNLFSSVAKGLPIVMVDQVVPPMNTQRYLRYFNDLKVVIVDRDPRDIFVLEKYVWRDGVIPSDVDSFCKWFLYTRSHRQIENIHTESVCYIQFEDMVYNYSVTTKALEDWLGLAESNHLKKKKIFNPEISEKNTQMWKKMNVDLDDIRRIEEKLAAYLYDFGD